jgi:hypothetical protein
LLVIAYGFSPAWITRHFEPNVTAIAGKYAQLEAPAAAQKPLPSHQALLTARTGATK